MRLTNWGRSCWKKLRLALSHIFIAQGLHLTSCLSLPLPAFAIVFPYLFFCEIGLSLLDGEEKLEFWGKLLFRVEAIRKVDAPNAAIGVDLHAQGLNVVGTISTTGEVGKVELDLVPALVKSHGHRANERLDSRGRLIVGSTESTANILVVKNLDFERKVLL